MITRSAGIGHRTFISKTVTLKAILLVTLLQACFAWLRAYDWVRIGANLFGQGVLLVPIIGVISVVRGLAISFVALLYGLFIIGALLGSAWARWPCMIAAVLNLLLVLGASVEGAPVADAVAWSVVPIILLVYSVSALLGWEDEPE
jgi:polyferredoxin